MGLLPVEGDRVALDALGAQDGGQRQTEPLQDGPLLDVEFEVSGDVLALRGRVADAVDVDVAGAQRGFQRDAVAVGAGAVCGNGVGAGEGGGAEEGAAKARAFLVGPVDQAEGEGRPAVVILGGSGQNFKRGDDAECAVEPAAVGDRVQMATQDEGFGRRAGQGDPGVAGGVQVAGDAGAAREAAELPGEPVASALPGGRKGEPLGSVGVGGKRGEFAKVGENAVWIGGHGLLSFPWGELPSPLLLASRYCICSVSTRTGVCFRSVATGPRPDGMPIATQCTFRSPLYPLI